MSDEAKAAENTAAQPENAPGSDVSRDVSRFLRENPEVSDIPPEVWARVREGESLTHAYALFELRKTKRENDELKARAEAIKKALPSQKSAGGGRARDAFIRAFWDE